MKVAIYRCANGHLRIYTPTEAAGVDTGDIVAIIPKAILNCPVCQLNNRIVGLMPNDLEVCGADLKLLGMIEVEPPL